MEKLVNVSFDDNTIRVLESLTIMEAALEGGVVLPFFTLSNEDGSHKVLCLVTVGDTEEPVDAATAKVEDGMSIKTGGTGIYSEMKNRLDHELEAGCPGVACPKTMEMHLYELLNRYGYDTESITEESGDNAFTHIYIGKGNELTAEDDVLKDFVYFVSYPPEAEKKGSIRSNVPEVISALSDEHKHVIALIDAEAQGALCDRLGIQGDARLKAIVPFLTKIGFCDAFGNDTGMKIKIIQETNEFIARLSDLVDHRPAALPMFSTPSERMLDQLTDAVPDVLHLLSHIKSPLQIQGAILKNILGPAVGLSKEDMVIVRITAGEPTQTSMNFTDEVPDIDFFLSDNELLSLINDPSDALSKPAFSSGLLSAMLSANAFDGGSYAQAFISTFGYLTAGNRSGSNQCTPLTNGIVKISLKIKHRLINIVVVEDPDEISSLPDILKDTDAIHLVLLQEGGLGPEISAGKIINDSAINDIYRKYLKTPNSREVSDLFYQRINK